MDSKATTYIGLVNVDGIRQGYFLSRNFKALKEFWKKLEGTTALIHNEREYLFMGLRDVLEDADPVGDPAVEAAEFLKGDEIIYVPVNIITLGMLDRFLPGLDGRVTTKEYLNQFYPLLVMNPLLEAAIICDLCLYKPKSVVLESRKKHG